MVFVIVGFCLVFCLFFILEGFFVCLGFFCGFFFDLYINDYFGFVNAIKIALASLATRCIIWSFLQNCFLLACVPLCMC